MYPLHQLPRRTYLPYMAPPPLHQLGSGLERASFPSRAINLAIDLIDMGGRFVLDVKSRFSTTCPVQQRAAHSTTDARKNHTVRRLPRRPRGWVGRGREPTLLNLASVRLARKRYSFTMSRRYRFSETGAVRPDFLVALRPPALMSIPMGPTLRARARQQVGGLSLDKGSWEGRGGGAET